MSSPVNSIKTVVVWLVESGESKPSEAKLRASVTLSNHSESSNVLPPLPRNPSDNVAARTTSSESN